ncbi:hypothetical protein PV08_09190 [Exophiala spinifera]|uniref:DUF7924 domain-containing protein n=1 Tax=Exophiala spinifera TaxID=91928 RepID=A0A0D1ZG14_9EURO|nr:uncharacterized protein PV08_09190 [Exophiala spinifera]KIW11917.1 hypothetical protein PV08_09190 [Exophiala spinifera]
MPLSRSSSISLTLNLHGRRTSSSTKSSVSSPGLDFSTPFGSPTYRTTTLEPNHIIVEDEQMDDERWSRLAFSLGIPFRDSYCTSPVSQKFAQQVSSRPSVSSKEVIELFSPLLASIAKDHDLMKYRNHHQFNREGVPDEIPDVEEDVVWKMQLPTPKPAFTLGYAASAFTYDEVELQQGVVPSSRNKPTRLHKLSQPVPDVYWPFFVVEAQGESMNAARNACAGSAATCNNALMIFAGVAKQPQRYYRDTGFLWNLNKAARSFSLAINGKTACLNTHNSEGCLPHAMATIRTYRLDDEREVSALASRICSIMVWAEHCRLQAILDLLDDFAGRVKLAKKSMTRPEEPYNSVQLSESNAVSRTRNGAVKNVILERLPHWVRT